MQAKNAQKQNKIVYFFTIKLLDDEGCPLQGSECAE